MWRRLRTHPQRNEIFLSFIIAALSVYLGLATREFFSLENLLDVLLSYSFLGIMSAGMLVVLISGGIDISFTAIATVAQYTMSLIIINYGGNLLLAFLIAGAVGIFLGSVNGFLIHYLKVPAIIITIATLNVFYGLLIAVTKGRWIYAFPTWFYRVPSLFSFTTADGTEYAVTLPIVLLVAVFVSTAFLLRRTAVGRMLYALGGNQEAAVRMGYNILRLRLFVYCFMGLLAGVASVVQAEIVQTVAPNSIVGRELEVLAAVVLGGASITGGTGTLPGTVLGVSLVAMMHNGLTLMGVSSYWHQVFVGAVIVISVSVTAWSQRAGRGRHRVEIEV